MAKKFETIGQVQNAFSLSVKEELGISTAFVAATLFLTSEITFRSIVRSSGYSEETQKQLLDIKKQIPNVPEINGTEYFGGGVSYADNHTLGRKIETSTHGDGEEYARAIECKFPHAPTVGRGEDGE